MAKVFESLIGPKTPNKTHVLMSLKQKACAQFTSVFPYENILKPFGHLATLFQFPPCMIGDGHFVSTPSMSLGWHFVKNTKIPMTFLKFVASYFVVSFLKGMYLLYLPIIIYILTIGI